jgi:hypothetical protein
VVYAHRGHWMLGAVRDEEPRAAKQLGTGTMRVNWVMMTVNHTISDRSTHESYRSAA